MEIRLATTADLPTIMNIYETARQTMRNNGNRSQWINGYPKRELIEDDISREASYLITSEGAAHAVFMFAIENDPSYDVIEGSWLNDEPYGVIHRIGSDGTLRGVLAAAVEYCMAMCDNIRIDTHADNAIMRHVLEKAAFTQCGTIYCHDGTPRIAYQKTR